MPTQELMATSHTIIATVRAKPTFGLVINKMTASASIKVNDVQNLDTQTGNPP